MYLTQIGTKTKKTALYLLGKPRTKDEICVKYILPFVPEVGPPLSLPPCEDLTWPEFGFNYSKSADEMKHEIYEAHEKWMGTNHIMRWQTSLLG